MKYRRKFILKPCPRLVQLFWEPMANFGARSSSCMCYKKETQRKNRMMLGLCSPPNWGGPLLSFSNHSHFSYLENSDGMKFKLIQTWNSWVLLNIYFLLGFWIKLFGLTSQHFSKWMNAHIRSENELFLSEQLLKMKLPTFQMIICQSKKKNLKQR